MRIEVTQEDIDRGEQKQCTRCPIARAVKRVMPFHDVVVGGGAISYRKVLSKWNRGEWGMRECNIRVLQFISDFDAGKPVQPFSFEL